jgi:GNAT superfamily N-acetyltransferase
MADLSIRAVDINDDDVVDEIHALDRLAFLESAPPIKPETGHWWLAFSGDRPVAYGGYMPAATHVGMGYLCRVGVLPEFRGHGLQRRFIRVREAHARRTGYAGLVTDTTANLPSANNLIRAGFVLFEPKAPWAFANTLYWRKVF